MLRNPLTSNFVRAASADIAAGCSCDARIGHVPTCRTQAGGASSVRHGAFMPPVIPLCGGDIVVSYGAPALLQAPAFAMQGFLAQALTRTPYAPVSVSGTKAAGNLTLDLKADTPTAGQPGNLHHFGALVLEVATSDNVAPGRTVLDIDFYDENGTPQSWTGIEVRQSKPGNSQFILVMNAIASGFAIPCFGRLSQDVIAVGTEAYALTAAAAPNDATSITPTSGLRAPDFSCVATVRSGVTGTDYTLASVTATSEYFDILASAVQEAARAR